MKIMKLVFNVIMIIMDTRNRKGIYDEGYTNQNIGL